MRKPCFAAVLFPCCLFLVSELDGLGLGLGLDLGGDIYKNIMLCSATSQMDGWIGGPQTERISFQVNSCMCRVRFCLKDEKIVDRGVVGGSSSSLVAGWVGWSSGASGEIFSLF